MHLCLLPSAFCLLPSALSWRRIRETMLGQTPIFRKFVLFAELDDRELSSIIAVAKARRYAKDDVIFHADESGDSFCLIKEGEVKVPMFSPEGKEIILSMLGPGDFFGEMALLKKWPGPSIERMISFPSGEIMVTLT